MQVQAFFHRDVPSDLPLRLEEWLCLQDAAIFLTYQKEIYLIRARQTAWLKRWLWFRQWMMLQVLEPLVNKLPVTLPEVNTVAHVLCALLMYIMRWHKPLLPHEPITLTDDWVAPLFAFMYMGSSISGERGSKDISRFAMMKPEIEDLAFSVSPHNATSTDTSTGNVLSAAAAKAILAESEDEQSADCGCVEPKSTVFPVFKLATKTSHAELRAIKLSTRTTTSGFFERRP
ncbi:MAG: hypothetical protein FRX48_08419 [Lasallia pustulata]|uniref:Uncharacterized protein n=1 Tax=Lasallia pustulata TaxID=136370 RepID=A0A5M8PGJ9_9LECA|nr:MAG: hypothetical protein FRX48_08419 [Lasallia pustulata]